MTHHLRIRFQDTNILAMISKYENHTLKEDMAVWLHSDLKPD